MSTTEHVQILTAAMARIVTEAPRCPSCMAAVEHMPTCRLRANFPDEYAELEDAWHSARIARAALKQTGGGPGAALRRRLDELLAQHSESFATVFGRATPCGRMPMRTKVVRASILEALIDKFPDRDIETATGLVVGYILKLRKDREAAAA